MEQQYIKGDIVMYDNKIHTIMDTLELNNYELSYISHQVHQLEYQGYSWIATNNPHLASQPGGDFSTK